MGLNGLPFGWNWLSEQSSWGEFSEKVTIDLRRSEHELPEGLMEKVDISGVKENTIRTLRGEDMFRCRNEWRALWLKWRQ